MRTNGGGTGFTGIKNCQCGEEKKEKKLLGYSGYDYNYCNGKNHISIECILQKKNEKKEKLTII